MLDRAALDVDEPGDADADRGRAARRRWPRRGGRRRARRCGPRRRRRARSPRGPARRTRPSSSTSTPSVFVAPMSRPIAPVPVTGPTLPSSSTSVTATAPGCDQPRASIGRQVVGTPARPAPLDHDRARPGRGQGGEHVGLPVRVADLEHQRPVGQLGDAGRDHGVRRQPPRRRADRDVAGRVDPDHPGAGQGRQGPGRRSPTGPHRRPGTSRIEGGTSAGRSDGQAARPPWPPRPAAPRASRPDRTASTSAAWIARTRSTSLSGADAEQVGAGGDRQHGRLGDAAAGRGAGHVERVAHDHAAEAEPVAQQPEHRRAQRRGQGRRRGRGRRRARSSPPPYRPRPRPRTAPAPARPGRTGRRPAPAARGGCPRRCRRGRGSAWRRRRRRPTAGRWSTPRRARPPTAADRRRSCGCRSPGCPGWSSRRRPGRGRG